MQRVATGLESAGLMRKKSAEAVRDDKDKSDKDEKDDKGKRTSSSIDSTPLWTRATDEIAADAARKGHTLTINA